MQIQQVLALNLSGQPFEWLTPEDAVTIYAKGNVAWDLGDSERVFHGGVSRLGVQSFIAVKPIIAMARSDVMARWLPHELPLSGRDNDLLFKRDRNTCAYCGFQFPRGRLTRDHVVPRSAGGPDTWMNCVTACRGCNGAKGSKPVERFMPLQYLPYVPNRFEHFILSGRNILADQHEYLAAQLPKHSRSLLLH
jgi:hypothetical protein